MFQIDNATAASVKPASTPPGVAGYFTDGNPAVGQAATIVPAEWLNSVMMEVINAVLGSGQSLNKASFTQLFAGMQTVAKNASGNFSGQNSITAPVTLLASAAGMRTVIAASAAATLTLPLWNTLVVGSKFYLMNSSNFPVTVAVAAGSGNTIQPLTGGALTSFVIQAASVAVVAVGGTYFVLEEGPASLRYTKEFASLVGANGYQQLPSGLIVQWGGLTANASGIASGPFPVTFPNGFFRAVTNYLAAGTAMGVTSVVSTATTNSTMVANAFSTATAAGVAAANVPYLAVGY